MNYLKAFLLLLLVPTCGPAEEVYQIRRLSEKELLRTYTSLMRDACQHADQFWQDWPLEPGAGLWGSGRSDNINEGIRAISEMALTCAALAKYSVALSEPERQEYTRKQLAAIRYAVSTHLTGTRQCTDGKPWGGSWQSALWTGTLGFGAWLIWDEIGPQLRKDVERVVASEADRFLANPPPAENVNDTKAEENGWNLTCLSLAANLFPGHLHAAAWNQKAIEYMMNTFSAPQDRLEKKLVDGRPVSQWFAGANVHQDFTLENHRIFHPAYVGCSSYFLTQSAMHYTYAHRPIPEAATHHLMDVWQMFQGIILPWGESAYPQGMDWELHGISFLNLYASLGSYQKDALAARLEDLSLQYLRAWQVMGRGDLAVPGSRLGLTRHASCAEQATYGFLAHHLFGPPVKELTARQAAAVAQGVRMFDDVQLITHRTARKFVSFSWTNRIMGMLVPIGAGHEGNPDFTVPVPDGLVGAFELKPRGDTTSTVAAHAWRKTADGFETTGTLLRNGGRLRQTLKLTSIGDRDLVYQDRVVALSEVTVAQERGLSVGIENDQITGGTRDVVCQAGPVIFNWLHPQPPAPVAGVWANVDGRLGVVAASGAGITYVQATRYEPGMAVRADVLYNSFSAHPKSFKAGEEVAHRVAIFYVEVTPKETSALASSVRMEARADGQVLRFNRAGGGKAEIPLF